MSTDALPPQINPKTINGRRAVFFALVTFLVVLGATLLAQSMDWTNATWLDWVILGLFVVLFAQIAVGFAISLIGFLQLNRAKARHDIMSGLPDGVADHLPMAPTAVIVPVYNEDIDRVLAGVERMWQSLDDTGKQEHFDIYILSDSNRADSWVDEECAWLDLCRRVGGFGRIFYRKRRHPLNRKSGNVADFCRRWGKRYRYMIVLDADSMMKGATMARLVQAMELNPRAGLIQTVPKMILGTSLFRRVMQFTMSLCGEVFSAGSHYWAMSANSFWGHNAIIRMAPFIEHCALPKLPENDPQNQRILSHDTIEAAMMRRAGYDVWLAYREDGSYEEGPPNLTDMLKRDRRWCQGNMQHFWFLFARNINFANRLHIWFGIMSYGASLLWLLFLILSGISAYQHSRQDALQTAMLSGGVSLQPYPPLISLLALTLALLFLPKLLGVLHCLSKAGAYGGPLRLIASTVLEVLLSVLFAPVLMYFHSKFVLMTLFGLQVKWTTQNRTDDGLTLGDCLRDYGFITLLGLAGLGVSAWFLPAYFVWFALIFGPWALSPLLAWATSRPSWGLAAKRAGLFLIPEETDPPKELAGLEAEAEAKPSTMGTTVPGFVRALLDPYTHAIHLSLLRQRDTEADPAAGQDCLKRVELLRLLEKSPGEIAEYDRLRLLWNVDQLLQLHDLLWKCPGDSLHQEWEASMDRLKAA